MTLPTRVVARRATVASAARITNRQDSQYAKRRAQHWQIQALAYYDLIGELRYAAQFYAKMIAKVRYFPARQEKNGSRTPITSGLPVDLLNRVRDPGGGRAQIQRDYGRLMFVTGDGFLFVSDPEGDKERWRFLWRDELKIEDDGTAIRLDADKKETKERGTAYRMWTPHPRHSDEADSPMRAVLDIAEELLLLSGAVRSTATTRKTAGVLKVPQEISPAPLEPGSDEDPEQNPMMNDMVEHLRAQVDNPGTAEAAMPFIFEAAYEYLDRFDWLKLHDPATDYMERDLRTEAITRLALSLDFPPEELRGMTDANHWTAQVVQYAKWKEHGQPMAAQFAQDLAQAYLLPALRDDNYPDAESVVIDMDDSQVVISPDRTTDADNAADRGMISDEGYRKLKGIDESMAPSEDEKRLWAAIRARDIPAIDDIFGVVNKAGPTAQPPVGNPAQPGTPAAPTNGRVTSREEARVAAIAGAAQLALRQCRQRAGVMIRSQLASKCPDCKTQTAQLPHSLVASALGQDQIEQLGADAAKLVKGGADEFRAMLLDLGVLPTEATQLAGRVELYAAKSLFDQAPMLPPGFEGQVRWLIEEVAA